MKKKTLLAKSLVLSVCGIFMATAQSAEKDTIKVQKRTIMDKFEPDYVKPEDERIALKKKRITTQREAKKIIDSLDISERKRRKLIRELKYNPFSERIQKTILVETEYEDKIEDTPKK